MFERASDKCRIALALSVSAESVNDQKHNGKVALSRCLNWQRLVIIHVIVGSGQGKQENGEFSSLAPSFRRYLVISRNVLRSVSSSCAKVRIL